MCEKTFTISELKECLERNCSGPASLIDPLTWGVNKKRILSNDAVNAILAGKRKAFTPLTYIRNKRLENLPQHIFYQGREVRTSYRSFDFDDKDCKIPAKHRSRIREFIQKLFSDCVYCFDSETGTGFQGIFKIRPGLDHYFKEFVSLLNEYNRLSGKIRLFCLSRNRNFRLGSVSITEKGENSDEATTFRVGGQGGGCEASFAGKYTGLGDL